MDGSDRNVKCACFHKPQWTLDRASFFTESPGRTLSQLLYRLMVDFGP